jgi:outer membrane protein assembly factor BamB
VHWLSREDGSMIARSTTDGTALTIAPIAFSAGSQPAVLFQTANGNLYAFVTD